MCDVNDMWTISDGSGGGSDTVGRVESESAVICKEHQQNKEEKRKQSKESQKLIEMQKIEEDKN